MRKSRPASRPPSEPRRLKTAAPESSGKLKLSDPALAALLFCSVFLTYWPALQGGFLWDDSSHITAPALRSFHGLWQIWFDLGATQQYYPLLYSAFWLEHRIWGDAVLGYHITNLLLHATAACLVALIVKRLKLPGAWLAAFIFALHPVCVESVAWMSEQKSTLSAVFYLAAALTYLDFDKSRRTSRYWLAAGLFVLALLSKTVTATLPAALLILIWWRRGRLDARKDVFPLAPWLAVGAAAGLFTAWVERTFVNAQGPEFALSIGQRFLIAGRAIWFYAAKLLWPANLTFSYPRWNPDPGVWWQYLFPVGILLVTIALLLTARRNRGPLAAFLYFAGTLFPVLGFLNVLPFRYSFVADHFQYLASLGIIIPATYALVALVQRTSWSHSKSFALAAVLLLLLGTLTFSQSSDYRDVETLYRATLARNPDSWMVHTNLGSILFQTGRPEEAKAEFQAAIRLKPDLAEAHDDLASVLARTPGHLEDAIAEYRTALRFDPEYAIAHDNLGNALLQLPDRVQEAVWEFQAALRVNPQFAEAHSNLGNAWARLPGHLQNAMDEYQAALRINPDLAETHFNLGNVFAYMGRQSDALSEYQAALRLRPDLEPARQAIRTLTNHQ